MDKQKSAVHQMIATNSVLREKMERDAQGLSSRPTDEVLRMAYDNGYRAHAAEIMSIYHEVEREIHGHNA